MPVLEESPFTLDRETLRRIKARGGALITAASAAACDTDPDTEYYETTACLFCDGGCMGSCKGSCSGSCTGSCEGSCTGSCSGDCSGTRR
jgi:hypothetical protein